MKKLCVLVAVLLLVLAASCDTLNIGGGDPSRGPVPTVTVPANMFGLQDANWSVSWIGGTAPYSVSWNFGGGANPNTATVPNATSPNATTVAMVNASLTTNATYTYTVVVTDSLGLTGTATATFVVGPTQNQAPVIDSATFAGGALTVVVSDPDLAETLTVAVTTPAGFTVDAASKAAAQTGPLTAVFNFGAVDMLAGATGNTDVTVTDGDATSAVTSVAMTIAPLVLAADTLYAIPLSTSVAVGDTPTVVIATGVPANPFQYLNGIGLTMPTAAGYNRTSFDVGVPDATPDAGAANPVDGLWATMNPGGGFLLAPDNFIQSTDIGGGSERWDFNITPIGGADLTTASGVLFNVKLEFTAAGTYALGFQQFEGVNRTYYTGADSVVRFWGDISNNYTDIPNTITVN